MFPSPYGVSFILMEGEEMNITEYNSKFPSPYGVSFILMYKKLTLKSGNLI